MHVVQKDPSIGGMSSDLTILIDYLLDVSLWMENLPPRRIIGLGRF